MKFASGVGLPDKSLLVEKRASKLHLALMKHIQGRTSGYVFVNPENGEPYTTRQHWLKKECARVGVKTFGIHAIRHLTASILLRENIPPENIQEILRHKSLSTTLTYLKKLKSTRPSLKVIPGRKVPPGVHPNKKKGSDNGLTP